MSTEEPGLGGSAESAGAGVKREHADSADEPQAAAKRPKQEPKKEKEEEAVPGHRKFLLSGIKGITQEALQGQIDRLGIPYAKIWKARNKDTGICWLKDKESFLKGCKCVLNGIKVHGREMKISPAPVEGEGEDAASLSAPSTDKRTLSQQVTPLCDMTYEDQIDFKRQLLLGSLERATRKLYAEAANGSGLEWVRQLAKGPICPLETMHHSPDLNGYRNKNEFTIGYAEDGKPMVTEILQSCADGVLHTPEEALGVARCMTLFLREHQTLACWGPQNHSGVWRMVMVRHNRKGDVMVLVQYSSNNCSREDLDAALAKLKTFFLEQQDKGTMKLSSLFFQEHNEVGNRANDDAAVSLAWGADAVSENILGLNFRISPSAFFQVNTRAAEVLYSIVRDWAAVDKDELILDVCCGTGTIGLCMAAGAKKVVGLELCGDAVKDAKRNAAANSVSNCEFEVGRAEDTIPQVCAAHLSSVAEAKRKGEEEVKRKAAEKALLQAAKDGDTHKCTDEAGAATAHRKPDAMASNGSLGADAGVVHAFGSCVAVLDPPREGVHWKVIKALRGAPEIERVVYVSCNHVAWVEQARALCCPGDGEDSRTPGEPFRPVKANGVDLFPHTSHVELVVLFERGECLKRTLAAQGQTKPETQSLQP